MKLRKAILLLCSFVLAAGAVVCLSSCGPNNEQIIRQTLTQEFDAYKNVDDSVLTEISTKAANQGLDRMGIDTEEFASAVLDGFDYHIDDITVEGKTAQATITFAGKSSKAFTESINNLMAELTTDESFSGMTTDQRREYLIDRLMEAFKDVPVSDETVTINYELDGNVWRSTNSAEVFSSIDNLVLAQSPLQTATTE